MPRSDSDGSSGGSITSEEGEGPRAAVAPAERMRSAGSSTEFAGTGSRGAQRFRQAVSKVIQMNQVQHSFAYRGGIGSEPGIDPRRPGADEAYGHIKEPSEIEVIDYSTTNFQINQYDNKGFVQLMKETKGQRPAWAKVRWINIAGISWDVLSRLGVAYKLHPLTLENIIAGMKTSRSKADYYTNHLFIHVLCQSLADKESSASPLAQELSRTQSPLPMHGRHSEEKASVRRGANGIDIEKGVPAAEKTPKSKKLRSGTEERRAAAEDRIKAADAANDILRDTTYSVRVNSKNLFLYLLRDGTVISVHQADRGFGDPIYNRLKAPNTILRASADPSLLLEALLDLVVDRALDIVDRFHENILACERTILLSPKMNAVRQLHFLSGELSARRRELDPVKTLIYGLRRYDQERCAAVAESSGELAEGGKVPGFLSHKAKIYLADVHEHCEWILTSFEMFEGISENLINYTFNVIAYETNNTMRTLTLVTIICLPMTLLTGYFGMNFVRMDAVQLHSDAFFWEVGGPVFVGVTVLFLWRDLLRAWHYLKKKTILSRLENTHRA